MSQVKLIAEPWDIGMGGYLVGNFPVLWTEWNGRYRDTVRKFLKGDEAQIGEFAYRISGSSDLYQTSGKRPYASINFITSHDGFSLNDLVSYNDKHNEANGENNNDGDNSNNSWNCGAEGPTDDPKINALRARQKRNFPRHAAAEPGRADAAGRRRIRPHPVRQQQRLLPGRRDFLAGLEPRQGRAAALFLHEGRHQAADRPSRVPPPEVFPGPQDPRLRT